MPFILFNLVFYSRVDNYTPVELQCVYTNSKVTQFPCLSLPAYVLKVLLDIFKSLPKEWGHVGASGSTDYCNSSLKEIPLALVCFPIAFAWVACSCASLCVASEVCLVVVAVQCCFYSLISHEVLMIT